MQQDVEHPVLPGAEAFSLGAGPTGVLLVHGFTGSPQPLRPLGEHLAAHGLAVHALRLPGHGTTWVDLNTRTWPEWVRAVEEGYDHIARDRDEVFVVGLSFGAALSLDFAVRRRGAVSGIVSIAGWVYSDDPRRHLAPVIRRVTRSLAGVANDIADPEGWELAYDRLPTAATHSALQFLRRTRAVLPAVDCPILVLHSRNDHTVKPANADVIYSSVSSRDKELVWYERSYHVLTVDYDKHDLFERTLRFVRERSRHEL